VLVDAGRAERARVEQRPEPESDVGLPLPSGVRHPQDQVGGRPCLTGSAANPGAGRHRLDLEAHMRERRCQQQVVLEAVASPPAGHELALEVGLLQRY
jgi:hypothetical protein